jgi:hypothetical protein
MALDCLPVELVVKISEHLAASYTLGSLAALNMTSRWIREVTLPVLFRTVILFNQKLDGRENNLDQWKGARKSLPEGRIYTR